MSDDFATMTPRHIVEELDRYIVGQEKAKKAVAVALRNRMRRARLSEEIRDEIAPKNILMIGPTGVGKTEIARRLAKLCGAPFIKVEATKYTEVGYVGRDVESMGIKTQEPGAISAESPVLFDEERMAKRLESLQTRSEELDNREADINKQNTEVQQKAQQLDDRSASLDDREKSFNEKAKEYENRKANVEQNAVYLTSMLSLSCALDSSCVSPPFVLLLRRSGGVF